MQQRDSLSLVIKYSELVNIETDTDSSNTAGVYRNIYNVLAGSPMFTAFQSMYDQVKLDGATIQITQRNSNNTYQSVNNPLTIVTAWDRSGLSAITGSSGVFTQDLSFENITQYSSAVVKPAMYGTFFRSTRRLYPSTLQEKSQWISTGSLSLPSDATSAQVNYDSPTSPVESGSYKFKPVFIMATQSTAAAPTASTSMGQFYFEYSIPVTFRGLRKLQ